MLQCRYASEHALCHTSRVLRNPLVNEPSMIVDPAPYDH